jgi:hypothetical protein
VGRSELRFERSLSEVRQTFSCNVAKRATGEFRRGSVRPLLGQGHFQKTPCNLASTSRWLQGGSQEDSFVMAPKHLLSSGQAWSCVEGVSVYVLATPAEGMQQEPSKTLKLLFNMVLYMPGPRGVYTTGMHQDSQGDRRLGRPPPKRQKPSYRKSGMLFFSIEITRVGGYEYSI